jgi:ABC-2 type transport system permease protein
LLPAFTLWWREIVRFYRQKSRVIGVLASPLVFWVVIGSGFGTSFRSGSGQGQQHYMDYFYPGALIMIVLFTSIFTMMSVIEDRKEGIPAFGTGGAGAALSDCAGQSSGRHNASRHSGNDLPHLRAFRRSTPQPVQVLLVAIVVFLVSFALTALGFAIAWPMDSTQAFMASSICF